MSSEHGPDTVSGPSPAEAAAAEPEPVADVPSGTDAGEESGASPDPEAEIRAAGGTVLGESEIAGLVDPSRVRRAPRYKRFAVLGGLVGLFLAAVATPFAQFQDQLSPWGLFLLLTTILVPFLILVSCAVAMFTDRAARVPPRKKRKKAARR